jgi:hypothetical protein
MREWIYLFILLLVGTMLTPIVYAAETTIKYEDQPPPSAISPSLSIGSGSDVCVVTRSGAIGTGIFSGSFGTHVVDKTCEKIKLSKQLKALGLSVAATSILCEDPRVFLAMFNSGSPCPIRGLIGKDAIAEYKRMGRINEDGTINRSWADADVFSEGRNYGQPVK